MSPRKSPKEPSRGRWSHFSDGNIMWLTGWASLAQTLMAVFGPVLTGVAIYLGWQAWGGDWQGYLLPAVLLCAGLPWISLGLFGATIMSTSVARYGRAMIYGVLVGVVWLVCAGVLVLLIHVIF